MPPSPHRGEGKGRPHGAAPTKGFPLPGGVVPRPTWCVISWRLTTRQAQRPGRAGSSRPTKTARSSSLRGGPQVRRGNPYSPFRANGFPRPLRGLGMTGRANAWPPCERPILPVRGPTPLIKGRCRAATVGIGNCRAQRDKRGREAPGAAGWGIPLATNRSLDRIPRRFAALPPLTRGAWTGGHIGPPLQKFRSVVIRRGRCPHRPAARPGGRTLQMRLSVGAHSVRPRAAAQKRRKNFIKFSETPEKHLTSRREYVTIRLHLVTKSELTI